MVGSGATKSSRRPFALLIMLLMQTLPPAMATAWATQSASEESKAIAVKGADFFKKNQFLDAAQSFEKAYALDARDYRVLRYAGRAWQEVGYYERALKLLVHYLEIEKDPELVQSASANVQKLRATTPAERAAALEQAIRKYPQARLEDATAKAYEALGDSKSLERAIELWEIARVSAPDEVGKRWIDDHVRSLRDQALAQQAAEKQKVITGPAVVKAPEASHTKQYAVWGASGLALIGGVSLMAVAVGQTQTSNTSYVAHTIDYATYRDQRSSADTLYYAGIGLTVLGAGGAVVGFLLGPSSAGHAANWQVVPAPNGLALAGNF